MSPEKQIKDQNEGMNILQCFTKLVLTKNPNSPFILQRRAEQI